MTRTLVAAVAAFTITATTAFAADPYPTRPITVIVPFAGGSASDVLARVVLERMSNTIGQRFVVDNRPGAGGNIGSQVVANAAPDGYTLLYAGSGPLAVNKTLMPNLGYDPEKDFAPVTLSVVLPNVIVVNPKVPANSLKELVAYAKANPKSLYYGSVGIGSSQHLAGVSFEQITGAQIVHVPYRAGPQMSADLISGETQLGFQLLPNVLAGVRAGQIKPLAVTGDKRMPALPDVPTVAESGLPDYKAGSWFALMAPRGTPPEIVARLQKEHDAAMKDPELRARYVELGAEPVMLGPDEAARFISSEVATWRDIIRKGGITIGQ
ncbi:tripartite tricarboxylate transporter substrate binding protein [Rhodoplanes sp. TEM]|uniref:Tripartite tricarboxylate transporter substrate binding protein n=1 Tax=Rhodoplanes tepidamans TaxID=200616 RepID=A0ABT5J814_RHOTP|nr:MULTISPECIES: tripartite tricarboxylate transporter substrate binding protein [Rhodoplanes]MDC7785180.1 tripartite tricarboxylate transporter substrate binding protein [Rhodoplanes tepidamans]MDC7987130.1 tripartite tricarboxylate transporter substrate binding protein [Rhodoplanes sp. TEM]MDQ0353437.1 tripartite-type tricarboxylate transporter receptor subunit TctC [Rhodoplanes tepidamans]